MTWLLKNAVLLDAVYNSEPMDVLVEGRNIKAVGRNLGDADQVVDLTGHTLLPGFIDAHVHVAVFDEAFKEDAVRAWAYNGVTTVRELGMLSQLPMDEYAAWIKQVNNQPETARVIATGKYIDVAGGYGAGPNPSHPVGNLITTADEAADAVTEAYNLGFPGIKIGIHDGRMDTTPHLSEEMVAAICKRAASYGMWVASHIGICRGANFMLDAGVGELAHTPGDVMPDDMINSMVEKGIVMDTTVGDPDKEMEPPPPGMVMPEGFDFEKAAKEHVTRQKIVRENLKRFHDAGGKIVVGTDLIHSRDFMADAVIPVGELKQLALAGMKVQDIIKAATLDAAEVVGTSTEEGLIAEGRLANLVAVSGTVDESFAALKNVKLVMHYGTIIRNEI